MQSVNGRSPGKGHDSLSLHWEGADPENVSGERRAGDTEYWGTKAKSHMGRTRPNRTNLIPGSLIDGNQGGGRIRSVIFRCHRI